MKDLISCDKGTIAKLAERLKRAQSHREYQRIQCVLIRATLGSPAAEIARLLGWSTTTVHVIHSRWAKEGESIFELRARGGRHHQHMSSEQEVQFLTPFTAKAKSGEMLHVSEIKEALQKRVGSAVAASTVYRMLDRHGWRKVVPRPRHPKADMQAQDAFKKLCKVVRQEVVRQAEWGRPVRLMFQDEGRFGLLGKPRRCWAPRGVRPCVGARLLRKFSYAFAAVSPHDGVMDSLVLPWVNASTMSMFLSMVSQRHEDEHIVMVMDQAGWHIAAQLEVPTNMRLVFLPPYSPEINPAEHIWDALREGCIGNTVFKSLDVADKALCDGLLDSN